MAKIKKGPQFLMFFIPLLNGIKDLGGSGNSSEIIDYVIEKENISENELEETLKSGESRIRNQIAWARMYLVKAGFIDSSKRGLWALTEKGLKEELLPEKVYSIFKGIQESFRKDKKVITPPETNKIKLEEGVIDEESTTGKTLLELLQSLSANGFERICQRLLRESGFQQVIVTGKSGDGGIDGHGILEVNPLVSFKVIFQCKRYVGSVSASQVRDFRGAMMGRADKGIIITTGRFTQEAKKEAVRDGVPPIEIVDGEALVKLFEQKELGLIPKTVYEIDEEFFKDYF